jgi:uncharacterized membrane protein YqjE
MLETRDEKVFTNLFLVLELIILILLSLFISWIFKGDFYRILFMMVVISAVTSLFSFIWNLIKMLREI